MQIEIRVDYPMEEGFTAIVEHGVDALEKLHGALGHDEAVVLTVRISCQSANLPYLCAIAGTRCLMPVSHELRGTEWDVTFKTILEQEIPPEG